jgi:hypothetical protein
MEHINEGKNNFPTFSFSMQPKEKPAGKGTQAPDGNSPEAQKKGASR